MTFCRYENKLVFRKVEFGNQRIRTWAPKRLVLTRLYFGPTCKKLFMLFYTKCAICIKFILTRSCFNNKQLYLA